MKSEDLRRPNNFPHTWYSYIVICYVAEELLGYCKLITEIKINIFDDMNSSQNLRIESKLGRVSAQFYGVYTTPIQFAVNSIPLTL